MSYKTNTESSPAGYRFVIDKLHLKEYNHVNLYYEPIFMGTEKLKKNNNKF
jgi:hypothetical protein